MKCIYCSCETHVTDKREAPDGTRRRRECLKCKKRFTTYEKAFKSDIVVVKKDGRRELYSTDKLRSGVMKACEKRPVSMKQIETIVSKIEEKLRKKGKEVKTSLIGKMVMNRLKKVDDVAYIRFASVYMNFQNINDFKSAMGEVK
jgi:transcriptional repressor NrdR